MGKRKGKLRKERGMYCKYGMTLGREMWNEL